MKRSEAIECLKDIKGDVEYFRDDTCLSWCECYMEGMRFADCIYDDLQTLIDEIGKGLEDG